LAGIVYDHAREKVYTIFRNTTNLLVYDWNEPDKTLTLDGDARELAELSPHPAIGGCGLALDEREDILYATMIFDHTPISNRVCRYDVNDDFSYIDTIEITAATTDDNDVVAVAIYNDGQGTRYLYTGCYGDHTNVFRTALDLYEADPNDANATIANDIDTGATGIAVDNHTGLVYVTASDSTIMVFDGLNFPSDQCYIEDDPNIYGPAGICVDNGPPTGDAVFEVKDDEGESAAWFDDLGHLLLTGTLEENSNHTATVNKEFRFKDSGGNDVMIIDSTNGNAYIDGDLYEWQQSLKEPTGTGGEFIIRNADGDVVAYIDTSGDLYLKGIVFNLD